MFRRQILSIILILSTLSWGYAQEREGVVIDTLRLSNVEQQEISIMICSPHQGEAYTIYGHAGIRVRDLSDPNRDFVYNYGIFDFSQPNFYWKFIKGETDSYMVAEEPTSFFIDTYLSRGSNVYELVLNLSPEQTLRIKEYLEWNIQPANRYYLYNFAFDNCSTRPYLIVKNTLPSDSHLSLPDNQEDLSLRDLINSYASHHPWYRLGTDLALGTPTDSTMIIEDRVFLPMEMIVLLQQTQISTTEGSRPLVKEHRTYSTPTPEEVHTIPWWSSPEFVLSLLLLCSLVFILIKKERWWVIINMIGYSIGGTIITFLVFCSIHPCTSPNINLLFLHPLLLLSVFALSKKQKVRQIAYYLHCANVLLIATYLVLATIGIQYRSTPILLLTINSALLSVASIRSLRNV